MHEGQSPCVEGGCYFCHGGFTTEELDNPDLTYREVTSWVTGPKSQSPVLREQSGNMAHIKCVHKLIEGVAPDQPDLPGLET